MSFGRPTQKGSNRRSFVHFIHGVGKPREALRTFISSLYVVFKLIYLFWTNTNPENSRKRSRSVFLAKEKLWSFGHFHLRFLVNLDHYWTFTRYGLVLHILTSKWLLNQLDLVKYRISYKLWKLGRKFQVSGIFCRGRLPTFRPNFRATQTTHELFAKVD